MDLLAVGKWGFELAGNAFTKWRGHHDPVRRQASRVISVFEAHNVMRQQISRLVPDDFAIPAKDFSQPSALVEHISPRFLGWAADILAVRPEWLDIDSVQAHQVIQIYKSPGSFVDWLESKGAVRDASPLIYVLSESGFDDPSTARGRFAVIYGERFADLGEKELYRYYFLSSGWTFEHPPCVVNLIALLRIADQSHIPVVGRIAPKSVLKAAESHSLIIPRALHRAGGRWPIDAWVPVRYRSANCKSEGHRRYWHEAMQLLTLTGLERFAGDMA